MRNFIQIRGLTGYFLEADLKSPCLQCGGTLFWAYRFGIRCVKCCPVKRGEASMGIVDLNHLELGAQDESSFTA